MFDIGSRALGILGGHSRQRAKRPGPADLRDVEAILLDIFNRRRAGEHVSGLSVLREHPQLRPELSGRLRDLRGIEAAQRRAQEGPIAALDRAMEEPLSEMARALSECLPAYEILDRLSQGAQGIVFKARHRANGGFAAIKVLIEGACAAEPRRRRFEREAELLAKLRHPHIVTLFDSGAVRGRQFLVMEFVDGPRIDDHVLLENLSIREIVVLFAKVCSGLAHAHQHGVIHRDLTPGNILVDSKGQPHICDFGLAKILKPDHAAGGPISAAIQIVGTLNYLSPEQAQARDDEVDVRTDVYAAGVVLYELLAGDLPFDASGSEIDVRERIVNAEPVRLRTAAARGILQRMAGEISDDLETVVHKALSKEKLRRYQTMHEFAEDLQRCLDGAPIRARADSAAYVLKKTLRRYRVQATVAALFALTVLAGATVSAVLWRRAARERDYAQSIAVETYAALNQIVTEIDDVVGTLAGGSPVRRRLLADTAVRIERLLPLVQGDVSLANLLPGLYEKRGDIAKSQGEAQLASDQFERFRNAARSRLAGGTAIAELDVARACRKLAAVTTDGEKLYCEAVERLGSLVRRGAVEPAARRELCAAHAAWAHELIVAGRYSQALDHADAALAAVPAADAAADAPLAALTARAHEMRADALAALGSSADAIPDQEQCVGMRRDLCNRNPANAEWRHHLLSGENRLATLYRDCGRTPEFLAAIDAAIQTGHDLVRADPSVLEWKRELCVALDSGLLYCLEHERIDDAAAAVDESLRLATEIAAADPGNAQWQRLFAFQYLYAGRIETAQGHAMNSIPRFQAAIAIWSDLVGREPDNLEQLDELAASYDAFGKCLRRAGQLREAAHVFSLARQIHQKVAGVSPGIALRTKSLMTAEINLAAALIRLKTLSDDARAVQLLHYADGELTGLVDNNAAQLNDRWICAFREAIDTNLSLLARRSARAAHAAGLAAALPAD